MVRSTVGQDTVQQQTFVLPLENFRKESKELSVNSSVAFRSLNREERRCLAEKPGPIEVTYPKLPQHCLEVEAENFRQAETEGYPILSALRLLKPNLVGVNIFLVHLVDTLQAYRYPSGMEADMLSRRVNKGIYELKKTDTSDVINLSSSISEMLKDRKIRLAIGRFNMLYAARWIDTRLLDNVIALEALYLPGKLEKKFRLCCYMSSTLSSEEQTTEEIWAYVEKAYDLRSDIVHGSRSLDPIVKIGKGENRTEIPIEIFADKIEEYTRESIKKFVERGESIGKVQSDIKTEIIKRLGFAHTHDPET